MVQDIRISFIIPSYNSSETVSGCISSIRESAGGATNFEIIVADSSDDNTKEIIRKDHQDVQIVPLSERTFPGAARNAGAKAARGGLLVFIDSDCVVAPDYYEILKEASSRYGVGGGSVENGTPGSRTGTAEYFLEFSGFMPCGSEREADFCPSCNLFVRSDIFGEIGGFSGARASEDVEFAVRLKAGGERMMFIPRLKVTHKNRTEMSRYLDNQFVLGEGSALIRRKYRVSGSFLVKYRILIPLLYLVRLKGLMARTLKGGRFSELVWARGELAAGLRSWIDGFKKGAGG